MGLWRRAGGPILDAPGGLRSLRAVLGMAEAQVAAEEACGGPFKLCSGWQVMTRPGGLCRRVVSITPTLEKTPK